MVFNIQRTFFFVDKLDGVECTDYWNKLLIVDPMATLPYPGVTYFMFRSIVIGVTIDKSAQNCSSIEEFSLRLTQNLVSLP